MMLMKQFYDVQFDLWVSKEDIQRMENGHSGIGYIKPPNTEDFEQISKAAFQPFREEDILDANRTEVAFIWK